MESTGNRVASVCLAALLLVACSPEADSAEAGRAAASAAAAPTAAEPGPAPFGEPFAAGAFDNVNPKASPQRIDLDAVAGKKAVVLFYWIAGNPRADEMFVELERLADELGSERLALYGVVLRRTERDVKAVNQRISDLGITVPVLDDPGFKLGRMLRVQSVPDVTILDRDGKLRLTNGASLAQELEYKIDLEAAIRRVAEKGSITTYGYLDHYYPVRELIGKKSPDFHAQLLSTSVDQSWSSMIKKDELNVLIFWSVDCPHCRKSLPEINDYLKANGKGVNVVSAARVTDDADRAKTKEFAESNGFVFPTFVDDKFEIANLYNVTSTPTILFIRPDGVIDSVMLDTSKPFGKEVEERKKALL